MTLGTLRPRILVSNDDGIHADGLRALAEAMEALGEVWIVAPESEQSAASHAISLHRPLRIKELGPRRFAIDGTPSDCSYVAVNHLLKDRRPDLMVSGINHGANLADDVTYSGTVAGAMEGALLGIPSIAVSLQRSSDTYDFKPAAAAAAQVAERVMAGGLPLRTFVNINVPAGRPRGFRVTVQARRNHVTVVDARVDPRGQAYYWIEEGQNDWEPHDRSDYQAVKDGYISVTPLHPDLTDYNALALLDELSVWREVEVE